MLVVFDVGLGRLVPVGLVVALVVLVIGRLVTLWRFAWIYCCANLVVCTFLGWCVWEGLLVPFDFRAVDL